MYIKERTPLLFFSEVKESFTLVARVTGKISVDLGCHIWFKSCQRLKSVGCTEYVTGPGSKTLFQTHARPLWQMWKLSPDLLTPSPVFRLQESPPSLCSSSFCTKFSCVLSKNNNRFVGQRDEPLVDLGIASHTP